MLSLRNIHIPLEAEHMMRVYDYRKNDHMAMIEEQETLLWARPGNTGDTHNSDYYDSRMIKNSILQKKITY